MPHCSCGAAMMVARKVATAIKASVREFFHRPKNHRGRIRFSTDTTITADKKATGSQLSAGVRKSRLASTTNAVKMEVQPLTAPVYSERAERENDALTGKAPLSPDATLARPWPTSSWFSRQRVRFWRVITR